MGTVRIHSERAYEFEAAAPSELAWSLVARPSRWPRWAPHLRGAWGLGSPEVREGARGAVRLLGLVPVPAQIFSVDAGRAWTWQVGPVHLVHAVEPLDTGCRLVFRLSGPTVVVRLYGPVVHLFLRNLGRVAEQEAADVAAES